MSAADEARRRAAAWLARHGDPVRRRRAAVLVGGASREESVVELGAEPDGVAEALIRLRALDDLGALHTPAAELVCAALCRAQAEDGGFGPGQGAARVLDTAAAGGWLGKTPFARPATLDATGGFLALHWTPDCVQGFVLPAIAAWAAFFANVPHDLSDEALQWCGRELERGHRAGRFDPVATARVLVACDAKALPGGRVDAAELVEAICAAQAEDGSFTDAARTYDALVALVRLG